MAEAGEVKCPSCGLAPSVGAVFCSHCGARLELETCCVTPIPPREVLTGDCAVLSRGAARLDIPRMGALLARHLGRPRSDVTRELRGNRGFLARKLSADSARRLAEELESLGLQTLLMRESDLPDLPAPDRMRNVSFGADGFGCVAYRWDATEEIRCRWNEIALVSAARLEVSELAAREEAGSPEERRLLRSFVSPPMVIKLESRVRYEFALDVFWGEPLRQARMDENAAAYAFVERAAGASAANGNECYRAARDAMRYAPRGVVGGGLRLLAERAPAEVWQDYTFSAKHELDVFNLWLLQLRRFGLPLPE